MSLFSFFKAFKPDMLEEKYEELMDKVYDPLIKDDNLDRLNDSEKVFYVLYYFNAEWQNGGLCQFFVNSSRVYAPLISEYLEIVGALEHKKMFDEFVSVSKIDLYDLSYFIIDDLSLYESRNNKYAFDDFDDDFGNLEELEVYLLKFMKEKM